MIRLLTCPAAFEVLAGALVFGVGGFVAETAGLSQQSMAGVAALMQIGAVMITVLPLIAVKRADFAYYARLNPFPLRSIPFVLVAAVYTALLSAVLNFLAAYAIGGPVGGLELTFSQMGAMEITAYIVLPALCEELLLRGAVLRDLEGCGGGAILLCGLAFAMLHGDIHNFAGPLAAGMIYAWLTLVLDSVWPAIFCHLANNMLAAVLPEIMPAVTVHPVILWVSVAVALLVMTYILISLFETDYGISYSASDGTSPGGRFERTILTVFSLPAILFVMFFVYNALGMTFIRDFIMSL